MRSLATKSLTHPIFEENWEHPPTSGNETDQLPCIYSDVYSISDTVDITTLLLLLTEEEYFDNDEINYDEQASKIIGIGLNTNTTMNLLSKVIDIEGKWAGAMYMGVTH